MRITRLSVTALVLVAAACANDPTEGKSKATVAAPKEEKAVPASAETLPVTSEGSSVGFVGAKVTAQHPGHFQDFSGTISLVGGEPAKSRVEITVKTASLVSDQGIEKLAEHLKSADFFDVEHHPTASFVSTEIKPGDAAGTYTVTGNLEIRGVKKSVTFPATIQVANDVVTVKTEFGINRKDFGITIAGMKDDLIKDNVLLKIDLRAKRG